VAFRFVQQSLLPGKDKQCFKPKPKPLPRCWWQPYFTK
jgi:hypothetical protein